MTDLELTDIFSNERPASPPGICAIPNCGLPHRDREGCRGLCMGHQAKIGWLQANKKAPANRELRKLGWV